MKPNWNMLSFFNGSLLMDEKICRSYLAALNERSLNEELTARSPVQPFNKRGSTAIISINGVLSYKADPFISWLFGGASVEGVRDAFRAVLADPGVGRILFDINSPGGEVSGIFDLADEIYEARGRKPIYAVANEMALSAGYAIASAADKVFLPRTGVVGSIGVVAVHVDKTKSDEANGIVYNMIHAGSKKVDASEHAPLSDEARAAIQTDVDSVYALFVDTVARNRGIKASDIRSQEAGRYRGKAAVEAGLADAILTYNQTLNKISGISNKGGTGMKSFIESIKAMFGERTDLTETGVFEAMGYAPKLAEGMTAVSAAELDALKKTAEEATASATAAKLETEEMKKTVMELHDICNLSGTMHLLGGFISGAVSVEDAKKKILDEKAKKSATVMSTVSGTSTGEVNPLQEDARRRAGIK
jgi:signal peptide peptidase SppA